MFTMSNNKSQQLVVEKKWLVDLQQLLDQYSYIFDIPQGLPPPKLHDHQIPLINEDYAIKLRPYRYLAIQKK